MSWLEKFVDHAHHGLDDAAREALWARGVSDDQIRLFRLGAVRSRLPPNIGLPNDFLEWSWHGRKLDDVFLLPLTNTLGQVKGLQFRHIDRSRTGYSDFIPHEDEPVLFGLGQAMSHIWERESIWLVEGGFDLFPVQRVFPEVVATLTARVTTQFAALLRRLVREICLVYDMDSTGRRASANAVKAYGREFKMHDVVLPRPLKLDGSERVKDPAELWETWGDVRFGVGLRQARDPLYR